MSCALHEIFRTKQLEIKSSGRMPNLINELITLGYLVNVVYITGDWLDVDEVKDMIEAGSFYND